MIWFERLGSLDATFLHLEDRVAHMHVGGVAVFEGPTPDYRDLLALIESRIEAVPRYRQRLAFVPLSQGRPVWVDDAHFDPEYHVRHTALPAPGGEAELKKLAGRLLSQQLDRDKPLWELWFVEGLGDGRFAVISKTHHCMVDGISGVGLLTVLLDIGPESDPVEEQPWSPTAEPGVARKVLGTWSGLAADLSTQAHRVGSALAHPVDAGRDVVGLVAGTARLGRALTATPQSPIDGSIGPHRTWAFSSASFDDVRAVRAECGGTVNDIVLTAVTAGYAALLRHRSEDLDRAVVRTLVPVSTRPTSGAGVPDNRVSLMLLELPVGVADHLDRLRVIQGRMTELKASHMVEVGELATTLGDLAPPMVIGPASRWLVGLLRRVPQRSVNTVTTNVPGPQFPLYCLGREMLSYLPYVPITHGLRVGTAILSYNGRLFFGVTGDAATTPDVDVLADATAAAVGEMRDQVGATATR